MDLFAATADPACNLLPRDGEAYYHGRILEPAEADAAFASLQEQIAWRAEETVIFGKRHVMSRRMAWHGDAPFVYAYSGIRREAAPWTPMLQHLKTKVEAHSDATFNACLLNFYHDGREGMGWHSDDEKVMAAGAAIASLSLGAERRFCFKHRRSPDTRVELVLEHGSLLVMQGTTQRNWLHALPKAARVTQPRINLTFRHFVSA